MPLDKPTENPVVSVMMPVYNCEKYVGAAIHSIIKQSFTRWELLICDDGSTDNSREVLEYYARQDKRVRVCINPVNQGKIRALDGLYHLARGEYVVFHDSDDISHHQRFELQLRAFADDQLLGLVGCSFLMIDQNNKILNSVRVPHEHRDIVEAIKTSSPFHFPTVMFRKLLLDKEEKLFRGFFGDNNEDVDLSFRILTKSKGKNLAEILYVYRILHNSISRKNILRNPIYYYSIARDLALTRIAGSKDWLDDLNLAPANLMRYAYLNDPGSILLYANSVSYFLSYGMNSKGIRASLLAVRRVSFFKGLKLVLVAVSKSMLRILSKRKSKERLNIHDFIPV